MSDAPERDLADQTYRATMLQQLRGLRTEVARLREALEEIADEACEEWADCDCLWCKARRALEDTHE